MFQNRIFKLKMFRYYKIKLKISDKIPYYKPIKFSSAIYENIDMFIRKYNKAIIINVWSTERKIIVLSIHLNGTAITFLENLKPGISIELVLTR